MYKAGLRFLGTFVFVTVALMVLGGFGAAIYITYKDWGSEVAAAVVFTLVFCVGISQQ